MEFHLFKRELKSFKRVNSVSTVLVTVTFDAIPATVAGGELPRVGHRVERRSSPRGRPRSFWCRPHPPFSSSVHDEPSSSEQHRATAAARRTGKSSPPQLDSSRSEPLHLAPKLLHPSTSPAVPYPGRIDLAPSSDRRSPSSFPPSSAPLRRAPSPRSPPPKIDPR